MKIVIALFFFFLPLANGLDFDLKNLNHEKKSFSSFLEDKPVLLTFWATWCGPCIEELHTLKEQAPSHLKILAVNTDSFETLAQVKPFLRMHSIPFEVFTDPNQELLSQFALQREIPYSVLFSKRGEKLLEFRGYDPDFIQKIKQKLSL